MMTIGGLFVGLLWLSGCSAVSRQAREEALPQFPFDELVQQAPQYVGQTVILGGYVVSVKNMPNQSEIVALQAPLGFGQEPKSRDLSQGRLILDSKSFLDPEVYMEGRPITVAGKLLGSSATERSTEPYPYLRIEIQEIHLWPVEQRLAPDYYYWDPWGWYPYGPYPFFYPYHYYPYHHFGRPYFHEHHHHDGERHEPEGHFEGHHGPERNFEGHGGPEHRGEGFREAGPRGGSRR